MVLSEWTVTAIGALAAAFTTIAFVPQVIRVWRLKHARDISRPTFVLFSVGLFVWLVYGLLIFSIPVIVANALTLILAIVILSLKMRFDREPERPDPP